MSGDLTLTAALASAVLALAGAVGVLWRTGEKRHEALERRTESHLSVATEQMKILSILETQLRGVQTNLDRLGTTQEEQLNRIEAKLEGRNESDILSHAAQMRVLSTIEAVLLQRPMTPIVQRPPAEKQEPS